MMFDFLLVIISLCLRIKVSSNVPPPSFKAHKDVYAPGGI